MLRLLFLLLLVFAIFWVLRQLSRSSTVRTGRNAEQLKADRLVACRYCSLRIPLEQALVTGQGQAAKHYCCAEHLQLDNPENTDEGSDE